MTLLRRTIPVVLTATLLAACAQDPLLGNEVRVGGETVALAPGTSCLEPGEDCAAPLVSAEQSQTVEIGVTTEVELPLSLFPAAAMLPVQGDAGWWTLELERVPKGTYLVTVLPGGEARQFQLRVQ